MRTHIPSDVSNKANVTILDYLNETVNLSYVSKFSSIASQQGVISDGTHIYAISSTEVSKYTNTGTFVTSRNISTDVPSQTHKGDGCYHNGILYISSGWVDVGEVGAILRLNASDLTVIDYVLTQGGHDASAIARKSDGTFWVVSYNDIATQNPKIYKYSSALAYLGVYELQSFSTTLAYDGLEWDGDFLLANLHEGITNENWLCRYYFDGTQFVLKEKIPHFFGSMMCGQGISLDPTLSNTLWANSRSTNEIVRLSYTPRTTELAITSELSVNSKQNLELSLVANAECVNGSILLDSSKNDFHATVVGATLVPNGGLNNNGTHDFDGVDDYIEINDGKTAVSFDGTAREATPRAIFWKPDGLSFFWIGSVNREVHKWNCSTAWDSNTATFSQSSTAVFARETDPTGLSFSTDGTRMFVLGNTGNDITYFTLGTAWDLSTLTYVSEFSIAGQITSPRGIYMKSDGLSFYVVGDAPTVAVFQYSMTVAWDMSTASYASKTFVVSTQEAFPQGLSFKSDGTRMYIIGLSGDDITEYSLTAWDVATCVATGLTFSVSTQNTDPTDMFMSTDGTRMFMVGVTPTSRMFTYTLSSAWSFSNPIYSNGFTLIFDMKPDTIGETNGRIYDKSLSIANGFVVYLNTNSRISCFVGNGALTATTGDNAFVYGTQSRWAIRVDSLGNVNYFVNGYKQHIGVTAPPSQITTYINARLGNRADTTDRTFDGYIGNVKLISRTLTDSEILNEFFQKVEVSNPPEVPNLTTAMRDLMSPRLGQKVYNTTTNKHQGYNGTWNDFY